jgi:deoxyribodipyrimidine photolyase-related protein
MKKKKRTSVRKTSRAIRNLVLVLGDQLDEKSAAFDGFDPELDGVWMAEAAGEATHVKSHKARIVLFLSAMRHFKENLEKKGMRVNYRKLDHKDNEGTLAGEFGAALRRLKPERAVVVEPGEWRVRKDLQKAARAAGIDLEIRPDRHFLCSRDEFSEHAEGRKQLRMEFFYREMRRRTDLLMDGGQPIGGKWNFDESNREVFGKDGPGAIRAPRAFSPDAVTREVIRIVDKRFPDHPGRLDLFDWPVTARDAKAALSDFVNHRLAEFGPFQDAMWSDQPYLYHARISSSLNTKLIDPRAVLKAAVKAYEKGRAPLNSVEGFVRQILGWREYVRGIYWLHMPEYLKRNALGAKQPLPGFYWTADTDMECLRQAIGQTLAHGYAHHIQRLMVTGLFALLLGVDPRKVHEWYLAIYVDAVEWVELPNTLGMSQYGDGGIMASKPYVATGKYIQRMSNYCSQCRFRPQAETGDSACPFTTLYWDFLIRHEKGLKKNPRMQLQLRNVTRKSASQRRAIRKAGDSLRSQMT